MRGPNAHRRLVEYFAVISSIALKQTEPVAAEYNEDGELSKKTLVEISHELNFEASITSRYPLKDHENNPLLHESIISFCHPRDYVELKSVYCMPKVSD